MIAAYAIALQAVFSSVVVGRLAAPAAFDLPNIICSDHDEAAVPPALPHHPACPHGMDCIMAGCGAIGAMPQAGSRPTHLPVMRVAVFALAPSWLPPTRLRARPQDPRGPPIAA